MPFIGEVNVSSIPPQLQSLIKYTENLQNFKKVNEILTKEEFDNYEASEITV